MHQTYNTLMRRNFMTYPLTQENYHYLETSLSKDISTYFEVKENIEEDLALDSMAIQILSYVYLRSYNPISFYEIHLNFSHIAENIPYYLSNLELKGLLVINGGTVNAPLFIGQFVDLFTAPPLPKPQHPKRKFDDEKIDEMLGQMVRFILAIKSLRSTDVDPRIIQEFNNFVLTHTDIFRYNADQLHRQVDIANKRPCLENPAGDDSQ